MRHSINIIFGKAAGDCLIALHKYILSSGNENVKDFYRSYLYVVEEGSILFERVTDGEDGHFLLSTENSCILSETESELPKWIQNIHRQMITIHNKGDFSNIHLCLYVPLLEDVKLVSDFITSIENGGFKYVDIDVICLAGDLCHIISPDYDNGAELLQLQKRTGEGLRYLSEYRKKHHWPEHLIAIQDYQNGGATLSLQQESLTRILGELSLMMIEKYTSVFGNLRSESDFQTFGISMLQLDRAYFTEYLLRKTLKQIAERENISLEEVDINMATKRADDLLRPWTNLLREVYRNEVKSALDRHETETNIVAKIDDILNHKYNKMRNDLESYITDENLSLPEKKAILSAILGHDDRLFINDLYDEDLLNYHDLEREAIEQFTTTNNYILAHKDNVYDAILSENEEQSVYPIDEMRKNRVKLRRTIGYIRELEKEQKHLEQQMELQEHSSDSFIGEGVFTIGEHKYKLLPKVDDKPLQEQYVPHSTNVPSVDLSGQMPSIKNQGEQGACLAFSLTSVFEYMYKKRTGIDIDLSEQFLYYNAREKAGETDKDEGSYLNFAVESLAEKGLCTEERWRYGSINTAFNICPSEEAYKDALERKLAEAKNVALNVDAIRSALADGYPVVFSAYLYDSFGEARTGFVPMPTEDEIKNAAQDVNRCHAMVIVGYNDDAHAFKVRNSWGEEFGIDGYIFMPYAYITNPQLTRYAAILTEIRLATTITEQVVVEPSLKEPSLPRLEFDRNDSHAQYGINKIMIGEAKVLLQQLQAEDSRLNTYCLNLKQKLKNPNIRQQLRKSAAECYKKDIDEKRKSIDQTISKKSSALTDFEHHERKRFIWIGIIVVLFTTFFIITSVVQNKYSERIETYEGLVSKVEKTHPNDNMAKDIDPYYSKDGKEITISKMKIRIDTYKKVCSIMKWCHKWWIILLSYFITSLLLLIFFVIYKKAKREIVNMYDDKIDFLSQEKGALEKSLNELDMKFHLAGAMLTQFFAINDQLESKSRILESFIYNVRLLAEENIKLLNALSPDVQPPFIPMLKNNELDRYFVNRSDITSRGARLYNFFEGYSISTEAFGNFRVALRKQVENNVNEILNDFSMYKYMSGKDIYSYLSIGKRQITDFLIELDEKSEVFMLCNDTVRINPSKTLYLHTEPNEESAWQSTYRRAFSTPPICVNIDSRFKIILLRLLDMNLNQIEWYKQ